MTKKRGEEKQNEFCCDNSTGIQTKYETKLRLVLVLPFLLFCEQRQLYPDLLQRLDQLPALVHLEEDVASAHELPLQVDLRDGLPVRELPHALKENAIVHRAVQYVCPSLCPKFYVEGIFLPAAIAVRSSNGPSC